MVRLMLCLSFPLNGPFAHHPRTHAEVRAFLGAEGAAAHHHFGMPGRLVEHLAQSHLLEGAVNALWEDLGREHGTIWPSTRQLQKLGGPPIAPSLSLADMVRTTYGRFLDVSREYRRSIRRVMQLQNLELHDGQPLSGHEFTAFVPNKPFAALLARPQEEEVQMGWEVGQLWAAYQRALALEAHPMLRHPDAASPLPLPGYLRQLSASWIALAEGFMPTLDYKKMLYQAYTDVLTDHPTALAAVAWSEGGLGMYLIALRLDQHLAERQAEAADWLKTSFRTLVTVHAVQLHRRW
jgi:hypothetical protein